MKIAYCIICHKNTNILREFISILSADNDIYLHVDKKSNIEEFKEYDGKVIFVEDRQSVSWGNFSLTNLQLKFLKDLHNKDYDYICLNSGECLPLRSDQYIKELFSANKGKEFIGIEKGYDRKTLEDKIRFNYPKYYFKKNNNVFERLLIAIQRKVNLFEKNKLFNRLPTLYKGVNWFCITSELSTYIIEYLEQNTWYEEAFKRTFCSDEVFFHTIVMNSNYRENIYNYDVEDDDNLMALRYIDWKSGPEYPKILTEEDFPNIKSTDCIFGRKFSEKLDIKKYREYFEL